MRILLPTIYKLVTQLISKNKNNESFEKNPFMAIYTQYSNSYAGAIAYNGDFSLNKKYETNRAISGYTEMGSSNYSYSQTNGSVSTGTNRGAGTPSVSILGHNTIELSSDGSNIGWISNVLSGAISTGTWVNGKTDTKSLHLIDGKIFYTNRQNVKASLADFEPMDTPPFMIVQKGTIGYNEKTKILAIAETNSSYQTRLIIWSNVDAPDSYDSHNDFYAALTNPEITPYFTNAPSSTGGREHRERGVVTVCDNGDIIVNKMIPSSGVYAFRFRIEVGDTLYSASTSNIYRDTYSTTYGVQNGNNYGIRHNITKNQKIVLVYSARYYYGSGMYLMSIDVSTGKFIKSVISDNTYGYQVIPYDADKIIINKSMNSDSGLGSNVIFCNISDEIAANTDGFNLVLDTPITKIFDSGYNSTNYPFMVPISLKSISEYID